MTKDYHLTQDQALEIAKRLSVVSDEGFIDSDYLEEIINAALDKVLGEPVATKLLPDPEDEREGLWFDLADIAKMKALPAGTKLYAPKGLTLG